MRRSRCFVFDEQMKLRSSQNVKTKAYSYALYRIYVCPTSAHQGFRYEFRQYKSNIFTLKATSFGWQSMIFKIQFNIIKYKNVKEIHFCIIFLAGKFVLSMNTYIFTATVSAILSNTLTEVLQYSYVSTGQISRKY